MSQSEIVQALINCEICKDFDQNDIDAISGLCQIKSLKAGEYVFQQGDYGEHLYVIAEGQVFLERSVNLGSRRGTVTIATLGKGRVLGCWSTLLGEPHILMSSAPCQKPTKLIVIKGADIRGLILSNKDLGFKIMEQFCFLLRDRIQDAYGALEKI